jgi:methionine-rich copper-binding protein CopC
MHKVLVAAAVIAFLALSVLPTGATSVHFRLEESVPEAGATVEAVTEVRLVFSQEPQEGSTSIRILDAAGEPLVPGELTVDSEDSRVQILMLEGPLQPGAYRVMWRAMAADGHVVRDEFGFKVAR